MTVQNKEHFDMYMS